MYSDCSSQSETCDAHLGMSTEFSNTRNDTDFNFLERASKTKSVET